MPCPKGHEPANKKKVDEEVVIALYKSGLSTNKIGARLGCPKGRISEIVKRHGIFRFRRMSDSDRRKMVELYEQGQSAPAIARQINCTAPAVYLALQKHGIRPRENSSYDREAPCRHDFFDRIDTPEKAYFLGLLVTDGCISGKEVILDISEKDRQIVECWRKTINSPATISRTVQNKQFGGYSLLLCKGSLSCSQPSPRSCACSAWGSARKDWQDDVSCRNPDSPRVPLLARVCGRGRLAELG